MSDVEQHGQDFTVGNLLKQLWSVSWPIMLSVFFYTLYNIVDTIWVGRLSAEAIAAVSISQISLFVMVALGIGVTVGSGVLISMHIGAKDKPAAEFVLGQSFVLSVGLGIFFAIVGLIFREEILVASGAAGEVFAPAKEYFTVVVAGAALMFLMMTIVFAFNAQGDSFTPTKLFAVSTLLNVILDPLLIFGYGPVPAFGITGAAYATLISQTLFIIIATYTLSKEGQMIPFRFKNLRAKLDSVQKVMEIGFPAALTQMVQPLGLASLMFLTAQHFHELGTVAFSIAFRLEFFAYLPAIGFGFGSMAIIGQNVGAHNIERAKDAFNLALKLGVGAAVAVTVIAMISAKYIIAIFTTDPTVVSYVTSYLFITGSSYAFLAASLISINAFQAMGNAWAGFWITTLRFVLISFPVAYLLIVHTGYSINGIWIALAAGNVVAAAVAYIWTKKKFASL